MKSENLPFKVEVWSLDGQALMEILSTSSNFMLAKAAFEKAVQIRPNDRMMLRERARVILDQLPDDGKNRLPNVGFLDKF